MASPETYARGTCHPCLKEVAVKVNKSGKAYYNCDHCGAHVEFKWQRTSDSYLSGLPRENVETPPAADPVPAPAPKKKSWLEA